MIDNPAIQAATAAVNQAIPTAEADPLRPAFHFRAPAQWMNDPNGPLHYQGRFHVFYQHNPFGDTHGPMYWGHAVTQDLVHWEHLPIALWPSTELGETDCFSGCAAIDGLGQPVLIYTKVDRSPGSARVNQQWAAIGDADLLTWRKHPANPILDLDTHGGPRFARDWRDPFVFTEAGRTFLVVGACWDHGTPIYEAEDASLARWRYRGILCDIAAECPNLARLGDRWIYLSSPYRAVEYHVGRLDLDALTFLPERHGVLDPGYVDDNGFYASHLVYGPDGDLILLGWVRGFLPGRGWNGCFALPRLLTLDEDGHPRQRPLPALAQLRTHPRHVAPLTLHDETRPLPELSGDMLEIRVELALGDAQACGLQLRRAADGSRGALVRYDGKTLHVAGAEFPYPVTDPKRMIKLHLFLDRSVLEVFVDDGRTCVTRVVMGDPGDVGVAAFAEGGAATFRRLDAWTLAPIW